MLFHLHFDRCGSLVEKGSPRRATSQEVAAFFRHSFASGSENAGSAHGGLTTDDGTTYRGSQSEFNSDLSILNYRFATRRSGARHSRRSSNCDRTDRGISVPVGSDRMLADQELSDVFHPTSTRLEGLGSAP